MSALNHLIHVIADKLHQSSSCDCEGDLNPTEIEDIINRVLHQHLMLVLHKEMLTLKKETDS